MQTNTWGSSARAESRTLKVKVDGKRLLAAGAAGTLLGTLPQLASMIPIASPVLDSVQRWINFLAFPGLLLGLTLNGWQVHDVRLAVLLAGNSIFYTMCLYWLFRISNKGKLARGDRQRKGAKKAEL
jgi:hypothetical protein